MGRPLRAANGRLIVHLLNRANARMNIFDKDGDYEAFESIIEDPVGRIWCSGPITGGREVCGEGARELPATRRSSQRGRSAVLQTGSSI